VTRISTISQFKPLLAIVGPTGVGKSSLALLLAQKFNGEIINSDSRQVYRWMDIGTAKPRPEEFDQVPHHLYNLVNPDEDFNLARYHELANQSIQEIHSRHKLPLLVGGSGQYVWAVLEGWKIPHIPPNLELRQGLEKMAAEEGEEKLFQQLQEVDPAAAVKIDRRNIRRVIRALEVSIQAKAPISEIQMKKTPDYQVLIIGLTTARPELYRRLDSRVEAMVQSGLIDELGKLNRMGYDFTLPSMNSIGYKQIGKLLRGEVDREEAIRQIKIDNHRFVRHQYAWFRLKDKRIHWFDVNNNYQPDVLFLVSNFLESIK
jgi:tRNA dimethylallyltransferase